MKEKTIGMHFPVQIQNCPQIKYLNIIQKDEALKCSLKTVSNTLILKKNK